MADTVVCPHRMNGIVNTANNIEPKMIKNSHKQLKILGVKVTSITKSEVLNYVTVSLRKKTKFFITTPNPEIIVEAQSDKHLLEALNKADVALPDGAGLKLAAPGVERLTGRAMFESLLSLASDKHLKVYLLGASPKVNREAVAKIKKLYPGIVIDGTGDIKVNKEGYSDSDNDRKLLISIVKKIDSLRPDLLFVALGAPKQEKWVFHNLEKLNVGGAMVIGGALDYFVGKAVLPPEWLARAGLEWLWRVVLEPRRIKRIFNAVIVFPLLVMKEKLHK